MNRRSYLTGLAGSVVLAGGAALAGCAAGFDSRSDLQVGEATVEPGQTASIPISASAALRMRVAGPPNGEWGDGAAVEALFGEADIDPEPSTTWTSRPPTWTWRSAVPVAARLPVRVAPDAPSGEYDITVRSNDGETTHTATGVLTVE